MGRARGSAVAWAAGTTALAVAAPSPQAALAQVCGGGPVGSGNPADLLVAVLGLLAWCCVAWLLVVVLLTAGGRLPGVAGGLARHLVRRVAPATVRRCVAVALGATVAVGVAGVGSASAAPGTSSAPPGHSAWVSTPGKAPGGGTPFLDWPAAGRAAPPTGHKVGRSNPPVAPDQPRSDPRTVVVRTGDTLWGLAAAQLGSGASNAAVASAWPRWWQANREVVGDDPDLLRPGQRLSAPS